MYLEGVEYVRNIDNFCKVSIFTEPVLELICFGETINSWNSSSVFCVSLSFSSELSFPNNWLACSISTSFSLKFKNWGSLNKLQDLLRIFLLFFILFPSPVGPCSCSIPYTFGDPCNFSITLWRNVGRTLEPRNIMIICNLFDTNVCTLMEWNK